MNIFKRLDRAKANMVWLNSNDVACPLDVKLVACTKFFVQPLDGQMGGACFPVGPKVQIGDAKAVRARNAPMAKIQVVKNLGD